MGAQEERGQPADEARPSSASNENRPGPVNAYPPS
jgi:hypothetical protein